MIDEAFPGVPWPPMQRGFDPKRKAPAMRAWLRRLGEWFRYKARK